MRWILEVIGGGRLDDQGAAARVRGIWKIAAEGNVALVDVQHIDDEWLYLFELVREAIFWI